MSVLLFHRLWGLDWMCCCHHCSLILLTFIEFYTTLCSFRLLMCTVCSGWLLFCLTLPVENQRERIFRKVTIHLFIAFVLCVNIILSWPLLWCMWRPFNSSCHFVCQSLGIWTQRRSWSATLGLALFKGIKGKRKMFVTMFGYKSCMFFVCVQFFLFCFLLTDLVKETDSFTAAPGWQVLKTAGLASAVPVGFFLTVVRITAYFILK